MSHRRNFRYRYYRCRSDAGGKAPCLGVFLPAEEIERTVCQLLASADSNPNPDGLADREAFAAKWAELSYRDQRSLLARILERVTFDPRLSTLSMTLLPDATHLQNEVGL